MRSTFPNLFQNATMLDTDFLKNEVGLDLQNPHGAKIVYRQYYMNICNAVAADLHYLKPTQENIEEFLLDGNVMAGGFYMESPVKCPDARRYHFLIAQARQLEYDLVGGRANMIRGEDGAYDLCPDTKQALDVIGLVDNGTLFRKEKK